MPSDSPVGIRLRFERGDVWIINIFDEIEIYDRRPPYWWEFERLYELREWEYPT